jgi:four helix bundle protein
MEDGRKKRIEQVEEMPVYQAFFNLALEVEKATKHYASDFQWLRAQLLRSSESVCANMTEGFYSQYSTEYLQALYRSRREARETMTHLRYAIGSGQLSERVGGMLVMGYTESLKQLANLILSIERKINVRGKSKPDLQ